MSAELTLDSYSHLDPSIAHIASEPDVVRVTHLMKDMFVYHPRALRVQQFLNHLVAAPQRYRPTGLLIYGDPGCGKTAQLRAFERAHPAFNAADGGRRLPVVYAELHENPSPRSMYRELLYAAGVTWTSFTSDVPHHERVRTAFRELGVRMLLLDEIHNICDARPWRVRAMQNWLKTLANHLRIPIVLAGTDQVLKVFDDVQLASRFPFTIEMPTWKDGPEFQMLLSSWQRALPLRAPSDLSSPPMRKAILEETAGVTDLISKCLSAAAIAAIRLKTECITKELLSWWRDPASTDVPPDDPDDVARALLLDSRDEPDPLKMFEMPGMQTLHALVHGKKRKA